MIAAAILFLAAIIVGIYAVFEEELGWLAVAFILSMLTVLVLVNSMTFSTSNKGYNVWKSYTISGNDTTDVTWHVAEKK